MKIYIDTETTGLCKKHPTKKYYPPEILQAYEKSRIVSIAFLFVEGWEIKPFYFLVRPDDFFIENSSFHGITQEKALRDGKSIIEIMKEVSGLLDSCDELIGYNIDFDYHILSSELVRYGLTESYQKLKKLKRTCIMEKCKDQLKLSSFLKLKYLYNFLFGEDFPAHNALEDIIATRKSEIFLSKYLTLCRVRHHWSSLK